MGRQAISKQQHTCLYTGREDSCPLTNKQVTCVECSESGLDKSLARIEQIHTDIRALWPRLFNRFVVDHELEEDCKIIAGLINTMFGENENESMLNYIYFHYLNGFVKILRQAEAEMQKNLN